MKIGVLLGSVREGRKRAVVADWVLQIAQGHSARYELIDLTEHVLPHLSEPVPPRVGHYTQETTKAWSAFISGFDGFVIVTPEYNGGIPGVLKNAIDHLHKEWNGKPVGLIGYGIYSGSRVLPQLAALARELHMEQVGPAMQLLTPDDFDGNTGAHLAQRIMDVEALLNAVEAAEHHDAKSAVQAEIVSASQEQ